MLTSVPVETTRVSSNPASPNNVRYSSSVLSFPPGPSSMTSSRNFPPNGSLPGGMTSRWPRFVIANVDAFLELAEEVWQKWMLDRQPARIGNQTLRCCISAARRPVDQYVVPRLIAVWLCLVLGVPFLIGLTEVVAVNDNSPIAITPMANQLAGFENRSDRIWRWTLDAIMGEKLWNRATTPGLPRPSDQRTASSVQRPNHYCLYCYRNHTRCGGRRRCRVVG